MEIRCHLCACRFETEQESGEVRCPRCNGKLTVTAKEVLKRSYKLGCPGCLKVLRSSQPPPLRCRYCGTQVDEETGSRLAEVFDGLEERTRQALLQGDNPAALVRGLTDHGVDGDRAFAFVDRLVLEVPFDRYQGWKESPTSVAAPSTCDACGLATDLEPWEAHWSLNPEEMRYRPEWGGFTGDFGKLKNYDKQALYYLCQRCRKAKVKEFAGGYPARTGYLRKQFGRVKDLSRGPAGG